MASPIRKRLPKPPLKGVRVKGNKRWIAKLMRQERQQARNKER